MGQPPDAPSSRDADRPEEVGPAEPGRAPADDPAPAPPTGPASAPPSPPPSWPSPDQPSWSGAASGVPQGPPSSGEQSWEQQTSWEQPAPWGNPSGAWGDPSGAPVLPVGSGYAGGPGAGGPAPQPWQDGGQSMYGVRPEAAPAQAPQAMGGYGQFTFPVIPRQPLEPLAVAGVATSPLGPVGIVLGLIARGRVRRRRTRSMRLAWTGVALGAVFTLVYVMLGSVLALNGSFDRALEQPQPGDVDAARTIASANLAVGNCVYSLPPAEQVGDVQVVPCEQEHAAQVVSIEALDGEFPGDDVLAERALEGCTAEVEAIDPGDAVIQPWYLVPSEPGWNQGNTNLVCLLRAGAGPIQTDLVNT